MNHYHHDVVVQEMLYDQLNNVFLVQIDEVFHLILNIRMLMNEYEILIQ